MKSGDVILAHHIRNYGYSESGKSDTWAEWKAPDGRTFVFLLLGSESRDGISPLDITWALNDLGWYSGKQIIEFLGEDNAKVLGDLIDQSRQTAMRRQVPP